jgi:hypothetical protein
LELYITYEMEAFSYRQTFGGYIGPVVLRPQINRNLNKKRVICYYVSCTV